jgi:hypothetical protein
MNCNVRFGWFVLFILVSSAVYAQTGAPASASATSAHYPFNSRDDAEVFLRTAEITESSGTKVGITLPQKLILSDGKITQAALFKTIDEHKSGLTQLPTGTELDFKDSWKYEVAAYEIDKLLGLEMVPVTVERIHAGHKGSLQLWLDGCQVEGDRIRNNIRPPDMNSWNQQMYKVRVFDNLLYNIDRNLGNLLISADWKLFMIDHSRTFKSIDAIKSPKDLTYFSRSMIEKLKMLNQENLKEHCGKYISGMEISTLLKRRDRLVKFYEEQAAAKGDSIIYP